MATFTWATTAQNYYDNNPIPSICSNEGWNVSQDGKTIRFNFANSDDDCGNGDCQDRQTGTAQCIIEVGSEPRDLYLKFNGYAEEGGSTEPVPDSGFERIRITLDGPGYEGVVAFGSSGGINSNDDCMSKALTAFEVEPPYTLLANETYTLTVEVDTWDNEIHRDAFWRVRVDYEPIPDDSSEFERVADLHGGVANFLRLRNLGQF